MVGKNKGTAPKMLNFLIFQLIEPEGIIAIETR
jgi:hypothetical protein